MRQSQPPSRIGEDLRDRSIGPFRLRSRLALGGMAELFIAEEPRAVGEPRRVVLKRMLPEIAQQAGAEAMFAAEAELGRRIEHPNVVRVLGSGTYEGAAYLVLELVRGLDLFRLQRWLEARDEALAIDVALHVLVELLAGLEAVHDARDDEGQLLHVVHGDVSPSNVLVDYRGAVKLGDLGVVQSRLRDRFPRAAAGRTRGKLAYLSPERVTGAAVDRRSDLFAVGIVAAELLTGVSLFGGHGGELSTLLAIRDARIDPFLEVADDLPAPVREPVLWALERDPARRPDSAASLKERLLAALEGDRARIQADLGALILEAMNRRKATTSLVPPPLDEGGSETRELTVEAPEAPAGHAKSPSGSYRIRRTDGTVEGPYTFAELVGDLTLGRRDPAEAVSRDEAEFRPLEEQAELSAYLPAAWFEGETKERSILPPGLARTVDLSRGGVVDALAGSAAALEDGVWRFERGAIHKEIYLRRGTPEFVTSNVPEELLGEFLVARGVVTRGELEMALAVLPRFDGRLGDTLNALGLIEPVELFRQLQEQVLEKLLELFTWTEGAGAFQPDVAPPERRFPLRLDAWEVLSAGVERRLAAGLEQPTFAPRMMDLLVRLPGVTLEETPAEIRELLDLLVTPAPLHEVVDRLADPHDRDVHRPYRITRLGLALGLVEWVG